MKNPKYHPFFITMCPTYAFIDRANGRFNRAMGFKKDFAALMSEAWDIDTAYDRYLLNPEADTDEVARQMGLDIGLPSDERDHILSKLLSEKSTTLFKDRYINPYYQT